MIANNDMKRTIDAFLRIADQLGPAMEQVGKAMRELFPIVVTVDRSAVKRVRTAYRHKKGKRW